MLLTWYDAIFAGLVAGAVMSVWKMGGDMLMGKGLWRAPKLIGTIALGSVAAEGPHRFDFAPVIWGLGLHELTSAAMGIIYAALLHLPGLGQYPLLTAVGYAFVSWIVAQYALIPSLSRTMARESSPFGLAVAHIVFGLALGWAALWLS